MKKYLPNIILSLFSTAICLVIAEVGLRTLMAKELSIVTSERTLAYEYHETLGWFPIPNSSKVYNLTTTINLHHNSRGFRDIEHEVDEKPGILFLGDSFTWGYDVEAEERFTDKLRDSLDGWNVFNLGVSGYGTDQQLLLLKEQYDFYKPEIIFVVFCYDNDRLDNSMNIRYTNYYKPYYKSDGPDLELHGVPVPKSESYYFNKYPILTRSYILRLVTRSYYRQKNPGLSLNEDPTHELYTEIKKFADAKGARLMVGLQKRDTELETHLSSLEVPYIDLTNDMTFNFSGRHWTPEGHDEVASRILGLIREND